MKRAYICGYWAIYLEIHTYRNHGRTKLARWTGQIAWQTGYPPSDCTYYSNRHVIRGLDIHPKPDGRWQLVQSEDEKELYGS